MDNNRIRLNAVILLLTAVMAASGFLILSRHSRLEKEQEAFESVREQMTDTVVLETLCGTLGVETEEILQETAKSHEASQALLALAASYPDCIGYIEIEGTNVSYPLMQRKDDNEYYLHRSMDGRQSSSGCIYMDSNHDITDKGLHVIYGHNMKNGTMFKDISRFIDPEYLNEHRSISIKTLDRDIHLVPFFCYAGKADGDYRGIFKTREEVNGFIKSHTGIAADVDDLYVLITCSYGQKNERTYLLCVPAEN